MKKIFEFPEKRYDLLCAGEIIMRLSARQNEMLIQANVLEREIGGAEFNVASSVSQLGKKTAILTKIPKNVIGEIAQNSMKLHGVSSEYVYYDESADRRMALYYYEYGVSPRKPRVIYDRQNSSFQKLDVFEIPEEAFSSTKIFHMSGVTLALSEKTKKMTKKLLQNFKKGGSLISFDVNFRANLWSEEEARKEIEKLLPEVDILFASEETLRKMFQKEGKLETILREVSEKYQISFIASTQRKVNSTNSHNFQSFVYVQAEKECYQEPEYKNIQVVDRIGSGDAYVAGVLYGILEYNDARRAIEFGNANSVLKNTILGDISLSNKEALENLIAEHKSGDIKEMQR